ncbi:MAG: lytic transglycosylase F [Desulfarculaceae bacterium]|nr:lytic transglycosylase F [Desulfarculaceae bacterium]
MKKKVWLITGIFLIVLAVVFTIVGLKLFPPGKQDQTRLQQAETPKLPLDSHMSKSYTDDLSGLLERKFIRVLTTLNRTNFFVSDGHLVGYEYSLLKGYEHFLNRSAGKRDLKVVLEFIPVSRDELIPKLIEGYGDIAAAGLTITEKRKKQAAFTDPYLKNVNEVVVTNRQAGILEKLADLSGKRVYVRKSSSYFESLERLNRRLKKAGRKPVRIELLSEELETESILEMVNSGALDITVADSHIADAWSGVLENIEIHDTMRLREGSEIAWMVRKENPELRKSLNQFIKTHKKGTMLGNIYFKRYFEQAGKLDNPKDPENWEKLKQYKSVIQKYAKQYEFDWLLILAVAFQESGLDHSKKSGAGAVGLMQVLPSTAKDKKIDISNIRHVENNVHAGVKYLAFLRDHYYSKEEMRPQDRVRMTLAAYNAGPAKIRRVRAKAAQMGLDQNRWFRNAEIAALRLIGQETVQYVSNINKYYVLYQAIVDQAPSS